jgi:hypothetical protein
MSNRQVRLRQMPRPIVAELLLLPKSMSSEMRVRRARRPAPSHTTVTDSPRATDGS